MYAMYDIEYVNLIKEILDDGYGKDDRTGVGSTSIVGAQMKVDLSKGFPALRLRKVAPRIAFEELMFMLNGKSQTKELEAKNINIWKGNTNKEFQEKVGLEYLEEGDFGRMYGVQLREFYGYDEPLYGLCVIDQLKYIIETLKTDPTSRRIITTHYNPAEAESGVLFPCHIMTQFIVTGDKLNCVYWMRSSDTIYGLPYNHMYYAFFTHMLAKMLGFEVGTLTYQAGDAHIYNNQLKMAEELVKERYYKIQANWIGDMDFRDGVQVEFKKDINNLDDLLNYKWEDVIISNYDALPDFKNKPPMAA